jgi:membrane associated rhomboid family serine protease
LGVLLDDCRHALRLYVRTPGASLIAVAVLAIGLAFVGAFLSLYVDLVLRPHPGFEQSRQIATYGFLHANGWHLFFNLFAIFMFGGQVEALFGQRWFLSYFLVCVFSAALLHLIVTAIMNDPYPTVGASGGVFGLLLAYGMYFPQRKVFVIPIPVPIPAWLFVIGYGLLELLLGVTRTATGIAHFAHLGGMLGGYLMIRFRRGGGRRR